MFCVFVRLSWYILLCGGDVEVGAPDGYVVIFWQRHINACITLLLIQPAHEMSNCKQQCQQAAY